MSSNLVLKNWRSYELYSLFPFRGIAIIGGTVIVVNQTDKTLDYYDLDLNYQSSKDMSSYVVTGNVLYGAWTIDEFR